jgi:hypothetical protein
MSNSVPKPKKVMKRSPAILTVPYIHKYSPLQTIFVNQLKSVQGKPPSPLGRKMPHGPDASGPFSPALKKRWNFA